VDYDKGVIIYGAGERGRGILDFLESKGHSNMVYGFCDQNSAQIGSIQSKRCFCYEEVKGLGISFLISIVSESVDKIKEMLQRDKNQYCAFDELAELCGEDRIAFERDFCAFFHIRNMDGYFNDAESEIAMDCFWAADSVFYKMFCELDLSKAIELACGRGRHVARYIDKAQEITLVDILEENIVFCKERFHLYDNVRYYRNSGYDLKELADGRYTALFSYDAVVHFEMMDIFSYLKDIHRVLVRGGRALVHHSNYDKDYKASFANAPCGRSYMSKGLFAYMAYRCGFRILRQEIIDWNGCTGLDCVSLLEK